jgi:hypothetical protein
VTLFIGNDNPKGAAAVASFLRQAGRPIAAPQGTLRAGGGCARVPFPPPVGARTACDFDGPEHDLLPELMGTGHVEAKVAFELGLASRAMSLLGRIVHGERTARWLSRMGALTRRLGTSAGAVMAELWWPDGSARSAALVAARNGQRMAALPCVLALDALGRGAGGAGALLPHELLGARPLLAALQAEGFALHESAPCP